MKTKKESVILSIMLLFLVLIAVGMSYAFLKTSFFGNKTSVLKVGSLSLILDETSGDAITVEDGTPMYDSEGMKQDNYFTFSLKNNGTLDSSYTIYLENQSLDEGDTRVNSNYVRYNLEKDSSVLQPSSLNGDQAIDKGIIKKNQTINYKMRLWFANDIPQSEENKVFKVKLNVVGNQNTKMMARSFGLTDDEKKTVTKVVFQDSIKSIDNESKVWDVSVAKNKTVMARLVPNTDDDTTNTLYIQSDKEIFANYNSGGLFSNMNQLKTIENIELLNTSAATRMCSMFIWCESLESLDVSHFDTSNVTDMSWMFYACSKLTDLDVSHFDTSKVTDMSSMFASCSSLTNLNVSSFDTSKVTNMGGMFSSCRSLLNLELSNFSTKKVTDMSYMFRNSIKLEFVDVSSFDTSNVTNMGGMFQQCNNLANLDVSNFDTSNVTNMGGMFQQCNNLANLDVSHFNTSKVTNMSNMFQGCTNLTDLNISSFDTSKVTNMSSMFKECSKLNNLDVSHFDTSNVTDMASMFRLCSRLTSLDVSSFNTSKVTSMRSMFHQCLKLENIDLGSFDTSNVTDMTYMFYLDSSLVSINFKNADFSNVTSYGDMFFNMTSLQKVIAKDATAKTWLEDKLSGKGTVTIA